MLLYTPRIRGTLDKRDLLLLAINSKLLYFHPLRGNLDVFLEDFGLLCSQGPDGKPDHIIV